MPAADLDTVAVNVGVYASVVSGGTIRRGDAVTLT
jgi:MOSC domain-containing protein YiiM